MIISASYKTDIPAFYGTWFLNRLRAGFCRMVNPYNRHQVMSVSLRPTDVEGIVFWTKNLGPFVPSLQSVREHGFPFVVQYTITGNPRELESAVIPWERSCEHVERVAGTYGSRGVVWRYDPILFTSLTPESFHLEQFGRIAERLRGLTDEVVVSFAQFYQKTQTNLRMLNRASSLEWTDPQEQEKNSLITRLAGVANGFGIQLTVCSQAAYAVAEGAKPSRCIDARRLADVGASRISAKVKGNRPDCECHQSRDIGDYDTCPHGCVYCYAVKNQEIAKARHRDHDPNGEFLFKPEGAVDEPQTDTQGRHQLTLF